MQAGHDELHMVEREPGQVAGIRIHHQELSSCEPSGTNAPESALTPKTVSSHPTEYASATLV